MCQVFDGTDGIPRKNEEIDDFAVDGNGGFDRPGGVGVGSPFCGESVIEQLTVLPLFSHS